MNALVVRDLTCVRGGRTLFAGLSFAVPAGGAALVTGPNGAGKSSLLRMLAGLLRGAGTIERGEAALLAEQPALDRDRTLTHALAFWARFDRAPDPPGRVAAALDDLALAALADTPVRLLSTGQRRRAAFARVVASGAPLWLLDEPANGLDAAAVARLEAMVARHRAGGGAAVITTHQALDVPGTVAIELLADAGRGTAGRRPVVEGPPARSEPAAPVGRPSTTPRAGEEL